MPLSTLLHPQHLLLNSPKTCVLLRSFISVPFLRLCFLHQCFPFLYQCSSPHTHTHTHTHTHSHTHTHTHTHTLGYTRTLTHWGTDTHTRTHSHWGTHTHSHTGVH